MKREKMIVEGNNALVAINDKSFINEIENGNIHDFLTHIKNRGLLPIDGVTVNYNSEVWDFTGLKRTNISNSSLKINFKKCPMCFIDSIKSYALVSIIEGAAKIQTIKRKVSTLIDLLDISYKYGIIEIESLSPYIINKYIAMANDEREKGKRYTTIIDFIKFYDSYINNHFDNKFVREISKIDNKLRHAEIEQNKTPDIPQEYFDNLVKAAIKVKNDPSESNYFRALACMILIDSQLGLRTSELFALEVGRLKSTKISSGEEACFIEYRTWKRHHSLQTYSYEKTYANQIVKDAYEFLTVLSESKRNKMQSTYLFVESQTEYKTIFPYNTQMANQALKSFYFHCNKYFKTVYNEPTKINGLSCTPYPKSHSKKYLTYPLTTQFRVHACTELYRVGCPIEYIEKFMSHLSSEMSMYYARPKNTVQENMQESTRVLKEIVSGDAMPLGNEGKELFERIQSFITENNYSVEKDLDIICGKLAAQIPIRIKSGGVCIKSSRFRECSKDAITNDFYCAYGVCPNIYTFYYMADISYRQVCELHKSISLNTARGCIKQAQKESNMLQTIITKKLIPQLDDMERAIKEKGKKYILDNHPEVTYVVNNLDTIREEVSNWK